MDGRAAAAVAQEHLGRLLTECAEQAGVRVEDLDRVVFHQANVRLVEKVAAALGIAADRVATDGRRTGNTVNASVPLTTVLAHQRRPFTRGDLVALVAVGAGAAGGAAIVRWY
jgi:3-oxoacyl-[acyl-carrier-protein] synthase III